MAENVAVQFTRSSAPYEAGDVAGFPELLARDLVDRKRVAIYWPVAKVAVAPVIVVDDQFTGLDRTALIAFARDHLGLADEPPADVTDDAIRGIIRNQVATAEASTAPANASATAPSTGATTPGPVEGDKAPKGK